MNLFCVKFLQFTKLVFSPILIHSLVFQFKCTLLKFLKLGKVLYSILAVSQSYTERNQSISLNNTEGGFWYFLLLLYQNYVKKS